MSERHPDRAAVRALLAGGRPDVALERHLSRCDACARVLREEAQLEEALFEVAESRRDTARASAGGWVLAAVAAAASVLLLLGTVTAERNHTPSAPSTVSVSALDGGAPIDGGATAP